MKKKNQRERTEKVKVKERRYKRKIREKGKTI